jgi:hypothetical protein
VWLDGSIARCAGEREAGLASFGMDEIKIWVR